MDKLNLLAALPEIVLLLVACVVLIADVVRGRGAPVSGIDRLALIALFYGRDRWRSRQLRPAVEG